MHRLHCIITKGDNSGMDLILWVTPVLYQLYPLLFLHLWWRLFGQELFHCECRVEVLRFQVIPLLPYSLLDDLSACSFAWSLVLNIHIQPWLQSHIWDIRHNFWHGSGVMKGSIWSEIAILPPLSQALLLFVPVPHLFDIASKMLR